jgi:cysteine desulfurase
LLLCDAVQGFGKRAAPPADLIAVTAHKMHGPKGIGALWLRDGIDLVPMMQGGGQEGGLRPGTLSPMLCAGFGVAADLAVSRRAQDLAYVETLWERARRLLPDWTVNGAIDARYRGNLNIRLDGIDAARLLSQAREVAVSLGSACASATGRPSHVLRAIGLTDREARASLRIGFGRETSLEDIEHGATLINEAALMQKVSA